MPPRGVAAHPADPAAPQLKMDYSVDYAVDESEYVYPLPECRTTEGGDLSVEIEVRGAGNLSWKASCLDLLIGFFEDQELPPPDESATSELAGGSPAYHYITEEVSLILTEFEIRRLVFRSLRPEEYRDLRKRHGVFYEIHERFYRPSSHEAVQPKIGQTSRNYEE